MIFLSASVSLASETLALQIHNWDALGQIFLVENVPARVNETTGEQFFLPSTEQLQQMILDEEEPDHFIQVPVYVMPQQIAT